MVDIKIFVGTNKIKIVSRKAADKINFWCNRAFVKGNTYYNLPEYLCIPAGMYKNLIFHLITGQSDLNIELVYNK